MKNIKYSTLLICFVSIFGTVSSQIKSNLSANPPLSLTVTATADSICPGGTSTLTAVLSGGGTYVWSPGGATTSSITVSPLTTQTYTVYATQGATHDTGEIKVVVVPLPKPIISGEGKVCMCHTDTLTVSNFNGPATYIWQNGTTTATCIIDPICVDTAITVTAYNKLGCSHDTAFFISIDTLCPTGINAVQYHDLFHVFPNPNNGLFTIEWSTENDNANSDKESIQIYNILGERIFMQTMQSADRDNTIDIRNKRSGIYFYRILREDGSLAGEGKLVIE